MTWRKRTIMEMAREAGFVTLAINEDTWGPYLEAFAELVREDEAEKYKWDIHSCGPTCTKVGCVAVREAVQAERDFYDDLLHNIKSWSEAYPLSIFPEPDLAKAREVLQANGMTLDAISASNMRHVITQVQSMIDKAIRAKGQA